MKKTLILAVGGLVLACGAGEWEMRKLEIFADAVAREKAGWQAYAAWKKDKSASDAEAHRWQFKPGRNPASRPPAKAVVERGGEKCLATTTQIPLEIATAGEYAIRLRYWRYANLRDNVQLRLLSPQGETLRFARIDAAYRLARARPYEPVQPVREGDRFETLDWPFAIETPGRYVLEVGPYEWEYGAARDRQAPFALAEATLLTVRAVPAAPPEGLRAAPEIPLTSDLNTSIADHQRRMETLYHECRVAYHDEPTMINLGASSNYGFPGNGGSNAVAEASLRNMPGMGEPPFESTRDFERLYPLVDPKKYASGEVTNLPPYQALFGDGKAKRGYSESFGPWREFLYTNCVAWVKRIVSGPLDPMINTWFTAWEICGMFDYSPVSVRAYRAFLAKGYGSIAALNAAWNASYASFDEIVPARYEDCVGEARIADPAARARAIANLIDFRDFCSKEYASRIGLKRKAIVENDPKKRHISGQISSNNLSSLWWIKWRPLCYEDTAQITLEGCDMLGYDIYGSDDLIGAGWEMLRAFSDERLHPIVKEGSTHASDAEHAARTFWTLYAKGMRGATPFEMHQSTCVPEHMKFGLSNLDDDLAPTPKLMAFADNARVAHWLENLMCDATRVHAGKPVAIYYSAACNLLGDRPYGSIFDAAPDTFFRVYEILRSLGVPVTFVTDRQIRSTDRLDGISAVFLVDAKYVPTDVQRRLFAWVERGGHLVCDAQPGVYDGHGQPTNLMTDFLGFRPVPRTRVERNAGESLSFGYSAAAFDVVNPDRLYETMQEWFQQDDATHPVSRAAGRFMFSGFGSQNVEATSGEVIVMNNSGKPGWIIRSHGAGTSSYFSGYLGTLYGAGANQYEWRDEHAGDGVHRFFAALLDFFGVRRAATSDLPPKLARQLRFESPLVDARGNAVLPVVSYAGYRLGRPVRIRYALPAAVKEPRLLLVAGNSARTLTRLDFAWDAATRTLAFTLPDLDVFANVLALSDADPIVGVDFGDAPRDAYGLLDFRPGTRLTAKVTVWNPSPRELEAGEVDLRLPRGWFLDRASAPVGAVPPYGASAPLAFTVAAPTLNTSRRARPVNFIWRGDGRTSTPCVEQAWFQKEGQEARHGL